MDLPWKNLPNLPDLDLPNLDLPDLNLPDLNLPNLDLPDFSGLPDLDIPELPDLTAISRLASQIQALISSAIAHPLWAIALILLSITLIQIIADLIKRSLKAALTLLLKFPLLISQWIWQRTIASPKSHLDTDLSTAEQADRLIAKLETLRQEQDQVLIELKALLNQPLPPPLVAPSDPASPSLQSPEPPPASQTPSP